MIINTDNPSEFSRDKRIALPDIKGRQLDLGLNYMWAYLVLVKFLSLTELSPHGKGNSFKVQIYSPYIVVNKTGLPFEIRSVASMAMHAREVAGPTKPGMLRSHREPESDTTLQTNLLHLLLSVCA